MDVWEREDKNGWILCENIVSKIIEVLGEEEELRVFQVVLVG